MRGTSTLTQQLVKNMFLTPERTLKRKVVEALMAVILEAKYAKKEILEAYLNEIYLGQRGSVSVTGVEEASRFYFGKSVSQLDLPEAAMLAGLISSPGKYSPFRNPENARAAPRPRPQGDARAEEDRQGRLRGRARGAAHAVEGPADRASSRRTSSTSSSTR